MFWLVKTRGTEKRAVLVTFVVIRDLYEGDTMEHDGCIIVGVTKIKAEMSFVSNIR